jgi:regulator of replication initiation timing
MEKTPEAPSTEETITFEVDRFEAAADRLEISGRWFGVRGRRFMRPSLTVIGGDGEARLLADIEHKPWAAEDGEPWKAAFPGAQSELGDAREAELTVSPDLTVKLALPKKGRARPAARPAAQPKRWPSRSREPGAARPSRSAPRGKPDRSGDEIAALRDRVHSLTRELDGWRARFESELGRVQQEASAARLAREHAVAERDKALTVRDKALAERDRALAERDDDLVERAANAAAREEAVAAGAGSLAERDQALELRDRALRERDAALAALDQAQADRDAAQAASAQAQAERDELAELYARLKLEHDRTVSTHGAALVMRNATIDSGERREIRWLTAAICTAMVIVVALVVVLTLH